MQNNAIQSLLTMGIIDYDTMTKTYQLSKPNSKPKLYTGKPSISHIIDILNHLNPTVKNNIISVSSLNLIPGLQNKDVQDMLTSNKIKYNDTKFFAV